MASVRYERDGDIGVVVLDAPPLNLFGEELIGNLVAALGQAGADDIRALVIRADGRFFTGGVDVQVFAGRTHDEGAKLFEDLVEIVHALEAMPIPTIASAHARWNVVNRVFPDGELFEKTMEFVKHLAVGPPRAHDATKRIVRAFLDAGGVRGPMKRLTSGLAVALVLGASAAALASTTSVPDGDDVTTALDIAKASGAHNRVSDQLVHTVDFYAPVSPAALVNKDEPPSTVCVEIWTRSTPGESAPDYEACAGPKAKGKGWVGSIARKRLLGPQLRLGAVRVEQPTATRIVMRIDPDDIKRPGSYRWRTESTSFGGGCKRSSGCADYAPDRPATAQTRLSKPRS